MSCGLGSAPCSRAHAWTPATIATPVTAAASGREPRAAGAPRSRPRGCAPRHLWESNALITATTRDTAKEGKRTDGSVRTRERNNYLCEDRCQSFAPPLAPPPFPHERSTGRVPVCRQSARSLRGGEGVHLNPGTVVWIHGRPHTCWIENLSGQRAARVARPNLGEIELVLLEDSHDDGFACNNGGKAADVNLNRPHDEATARRKQENDAPCARSLAEPSRPSRTTSRQ